MTAETPFAYAAMLIRKPVAAVFAAIVEPDITSQFWFTHGSGKLEAGRTVEWKWEMYGVSTSVVVKAIEPDRRILLECYSGRTTVEWMFQQVPDGTFVEVRETGWTGTDDEMVKYVRDSTGGFSLTLAGMKAFLEHGLKLNLVGDRFPTGATPKLA
jgi:uncharacterized protein YndB with AHSA1/START domain